MAPPYSRAIDHLHNDARETGTVAPPA